MGLIQVFNSITKQFNLVESGSGPVGPVGPGGVLGWIDVVSNSYTAVPNYGYTADNMTQAVQFSLPATAAYGSVLRFVAVQSNGFVLKQASGQTIHIGNQSTTTGTSGSVSSTNIYDAIELLCCVANTDWVAINGPQGNLSII